MSLSSTEQIGEVETVSCEFEWRIPNFVSILEEAILKKCYFKSPSFSFSRASWNMVISLPGSSSSDEVNSIQFISLYLFKSDSISPTGLKVCFALKTSKGKKEHTKPYTHCGNLKNCSYGIHQYIQKCELLQNNSELLPSDVLTVVCTLEYSKSIEDASEACASEPSIVPQDNKVLHDLRELLLKKEDYEVFIKVKGQEFPAHRSILKAHCSIFASSFQCKTKEKETGIVEIENSDNSSFSDFLCFLYCGDMGLISLENVFNLYTAANLYNVGDLRTKCVKFMKENLSIDTFCDIITSAQHHSEAELINFTTNFFVKNAPKIIVTFKWQTILAKNPTLCNDLFIKLLVPDTNLSN